MADYLLYWKVYWRHIKEEPTVGSWHTKRQSFFNEVNPGDDFWIVVSGGPNNPHEWRLVERLHIKAKRVEPEETGFGKYLFIGDPQQSEVFDINAQSNFEPTLKKLEFTSGKKIEARGARIGLYIQMFRHLTKHDVNLLQEFVGLHLGAKEEPPKLDSSGDKIMPIEFERDFEHPSEMESEAEPAAPEADTRPVISQAAKPTIGNLHERMITEFDAKLPAELNPIEIDSLPPEDEDDIKSGYVPERDENLLLIPPSERRVITQPYDYSVDMIVRQIDASALLVQPPYQRGYVWDNGRASRLIESLLMNIPIPPCYFAEEEPGISTVIDGHQRLYSIWRFVNNKFRLRSLTTLDELKGKGYKDLTEREQRIILSRTIRCILLTQDSHPEIRFEVFERLNTGSMQLTDQEIRNAIYRGDFNKLIQSLADQPRWIQVLNKEQLDKRMRDDELVLRFFSVHDNYLGYQAPLRSFLNRYMASKTWTKSKPKLHIQLDDVERTRLTTLFEETVDKVIAVFGDHAFRSYSDGWERQVNRALFDAVMLVFSKLPDDQLKASGQDVEKALIGLCQDRAFFQTISRGTADRANLFARIRMFSQALAYFGLDSGVHQTLQPK